MEQIKNLSPFLLLLLLLLLLFNSCDSAEGKYKELYQQQLAVTDTLQTRINELSNKIDLIWLMSKTKIDSLNTIIVIKDGEIFRLNNIIASFNCDSAAIIRSFHETQLMPYLFIPLNNKLNQIIDSLNRR